MRRWLAEPLLHFALAGAALFGAYAWLERGATDEPQVVRISAAEVDWLRETWTRQRESEPSRDELRGLVADYLKEVLLAREATELGLDQNDTVVRRRLAQKMEFLVQDTARLTEPDEAELRRLYESGRERFQTRALVSFEQIFFESEAAARDASKQLATRSAAEFGERTLLDRAYTRVDAQAVASVFGREFADRVFALEPGRWHGPLPSSYGFHLVQLREREESQPRSYDDARAELLEAWQRGQQVRAHEQFLAGLRRKYDVELEEGVEPLVGSLDELAR